MSVYKSRRALSKVQYVSKAIKFRETTIRIVKRFPKSYRYVITNNLLATVTKIHHHVVEANAIYMHRLMDEKDYELRHRYLTMALGEVDAALTDITMCDTLLANDNDGNTFKDKETRRRTFYNWVADANELRLLIKGVIDNDKKRRKQWQTDDSDDNIDDEKENIDNNNNNNKAGNNQ